MLCFCRDYPQFSYIDSNRHKLWHRHGFVSYMWLFTWRLCWRSPAVRRLRRKHGSRTLVFNIFRNRFTCVLFTTSWDTHPRLPISLLSGRYLHSKSQSSCRFDYFDFCHLPDLHVNDKNCSLAWILRIPWLWVFSASTKESSETLNFPISTVLANFACSEALRTSVSRFAVSFSIESPRACATLFV